MELKRLEKKFPNCEFDLTSSEFNEQTEKREIYCNGRAKRDWDFEVRFRGKTKSKKMLYFHDMYQNKYNIIYEYLKNKKSANQISIEINKQFDIFPIQKSDFSLFLRF